MHVTVSWGRFNTTGSVDDLACVLQHIRSKVSGVPVYGVGLSAGSSLLARYLGDTGSSSLIAAGVCISPGFSFRKSLSTMSRSTGALVLSRMKAFFLTPNASVLQDLPGYTEMQASKTQMEWHVHQYNFSPHGNMESYFLNEDPDHVLHNIQVPIIYLNAKDVRTLSPPRTQEIVLTRSCHCEGYRVSRAGAYVCVCRACAHQRARRRCPN